LIVDSTGRTVCFVERGNASLVKTAPELEAACVGARTAIETLMGKLMRKDPKFLPSKCGQPHAALVELNRVLVKAGGRL